MSHTLTIKQTQQYFKFQNFYFDFLLQKNECITLPTFQSNASFMFQGDYNKFEKIVQSAIEYRNAINQIKGVYSVAKYRRENEDRIDYMGAYGEQLISYLNYRFNITGNVTNYQQSNTAEYHLIKGCDLQFDYQNEQYKYEIKCTLSDNVKINDVALRDLIANDCDILVVQLDKDNNKTILHKMSHQYFIDNSIKKDGQNNTYYYQYNLNKNKQK